MEHIKYLIAPRELLRNKYALGLPRDILHLKFIQAALSLDASIVEDYIPYDMQLQNMSKTMFLITLKSLFDVLKMQCHDYPRVELGNHICKSCNCGKPLASFEVYAGNSAEPFYTFAYFIDVDAVGMTQDIYECNGFMKPNN